jgi:ADP-heptose:LPS heptosyltransferase
MDRPPATATVLLWKIGALGDVLMTTPLLRQLRAHLPHARIDYLVGRSSRGVLQGNPYIDGVLEFDERILHWGQVSRLGEVLALLRGYDTVYVLDKHWIFGSLARAAGIPRRIGFRRRAVEGWAHSIQVPYGALRHEIDCYLDLAVAAGVPVNRADRALQLPASEPFANLDQPYVVAINSGGSNPGEASEVRKLPAPLFSDLVAALAVRTPVVFLGSRQERGAYEQLAARHAAHNLCGATHLRQAWAVLAHAQAVYTTDTGLMHMAAAINGAVTAVFGPTHPLRKCPPGARWVWGDEDRYDPRYELFGKVPAGRWFETLTVTDVLDPARSAPFPASPALDRDHQAA